MLILHPIHLVLWSAFLNDNRYVSEKLGVFEGACTYIKGAYRPSEESMMNSNTEGLMLLPVKRYMIK